MIESKAEKNVTLVSQPVAASGASEVCPKSARPEQIVKKFRESWNETKIARIN
jgi:hypothetical protein